MYRNRIDMKKVIITGGSRGIGAAIAEMFRKNGDKVAVIYNNNDTAANELAERIGVYAVKADVSDAESAENGIKTAVEKLGGVDVLVNCAGIAQIKLFTEISNEDWRRMIDTNLTGAFTMSRYASRIMINQQSGRIINIGSMWGKKGASCEVHYSAAKSGLRGMTKALAKELGPSNITVNCVEPGFIDTEMNAGFDEDTVNALIEATPMCRVGKPEDIAEMVCFLASEKASFITGQCIGVDGGIIS